MKSIIFLFTAILLILFSCSSDKQLDTYYHIVDSADSIKFYVRYGDTFIVTKNINSTEHLKSVKQILKRNIQPEYQRKFIAQRKVELYNSNKLLGVLLISGEKEDQFVNFTNGRFGFGFKLTYGIGMSL